MRGELALLPVVVIVPGDTCADIVDKYPQQTQLVHGTLRFTADCLVAQGVGPISCRGTS